jgi:putative two-component system hydrogenase maturation factor HypX/HoxX
MGLYGSEYWTYLLPRRIGTERARQFTEQCLPWGTDIALEVKLIDECIAASGADFIQEVKRIAGAVSQLAYLDKLMQAKQFKRKRDEAHKPLSKYREEELAKMHKNFFEDDQQFDVKRYAFVHKRSMDVAQHQWAGQDLFSKRRAIWRRRKYEPLFYSEQ